MLQEKQRTIKLIDFSFFLHSLFVNPLKPSDVWYSIEELTLTYIIAKFYGFGKTLLWKTFYFINF